VDEELFVRWTQASALLPIMQFSYAPWRLTEKMAAICRTYVKLHEDLSGYIYRLAQDATSDGTPIVRPLFFNYPKDRAAYRVRDQFLLGDRFLVAPVLTRGARHRSVYLPEGAWKDYWSGAVVFGPRLIKAYDANLEKLPLFERVTTQAETPQERAGRRQAKDSRARAWAPGPPLPPALRRAPIGGKSDQKCLGRHCRSHQEKSK
jgi:myogenesis-regulating glycosidase